MTVLLIVLAPQHALEEPIVAAVLVVIAYDGDRALVMQLFPPLLVLGDVASHIIVGAEAHQPLTVRQSGRVALHTLQVQYYQRQPTGPPTTRRG